MFDPPVVYVSLETKLLLHRDKCCEVIVNCTMDNRGIKHCCVSAAEPVFLLDEISDLIKLNGTGQLIMLVDMKTTSELFCL